MFPRPMLASPAFKPFMEAAGIEPAQDSPGRCVGCPGGADYLVELESGMVATVCDRCVMVVPRRGGPRSWVYFIEGAGKVKIGYSKTPLARVRMHQTGSPVPLKLVYLLEGTRRVEKHFHVALGGYVSHGEWFDGTTEFWNLVFDARIRASLNEYRRELEAA